MPTVKELKDELDSLGITYSSKDRKADLEELLTRVGVSDPPKMHRRLFACGSCGEMIEGPPCETCGWGFKDPNAEADTQAV